MSQPQPEAPEPQEPVEAPSSAPVMSDADLHTASMTELIRIARDLGIKDAAALRKRGLIFRILASQTPSIRTRGVLDILEPEPPEEGQKQEAEVDGYRHPEEAKVQHDGSAVSSIIAS